MLLVASVVTVYFNSFLVQDGADLYLRSITGDFWRIVDYNRWARMLVYLPTRIASYFTTGHTILLYIFSSTFVLLNLLLFYYAAKRLNNTLHFLLFFLSTQISFFYQRLISLKGLAVLSIWLYLFVGKKTRAVLSILFAFTHVYFIGFVGLWKLYELWVNKFSKVTRLDLIEYFAILIGIFNFFILNVEIADEAYRGIEILLSTEYLHFYFLFGFTSLILFTPKNLLINKYVMVLFLTVPLIFITFFIQKYGFTLHCWYRTYKVVYFLISLTYVYLFVRTKRADGESILFNVTLILSALVIYGTVIMNSFYHYKFWSKVIQKTQSIEKPCWDPRELDMIHTIDENPFWFCYEMSPDTFIQFLIETDQHKIKSVLNVKYDTMSCDEVVNEKKYHELMSYQKDRFNNRFFDIDFLINQPNNFRDKN